MANFQHCVKKSQETWKKGHQRTVLKLWFYGCFWGRFPPFCVHVRCQNLELSAAAAAEALERSELREVFFESETQLWCATEEWGWSEDLEMSFWSKAKNFPFSECIKADFYCLSINSIEKNTHSTTHPSKLDVTLIRQPISTHKLHQDHYSHTTTVITTAVSQLDCIQPYSYHS